MRKTLGVVNELRIYQSDSSCDFQLRLQFTIRSASDTKKLLEFASVRSSLTFGDIAWNRNSSTPQLACEPESLFAREAFCKGIHNHRQIHRFLPDLQIAERSNPCAARRLAYCALFTVHCSLPLPNSPIADDGGDEQRADCQYSKVVRVARAFSALRACVVEGDENP